MNENLKKAAELLRSSELAYVWAQFRNPQWMYVEDYDETLQNLDDLARCSWDGLVEILQRDGYFELKSMLKALSRHRVNTENTIKDIWDRLSYQQRALRACSQEAEKHGLESLVKAAIKVLDTSDGVWSVSYPFGTSQEDFVDGTVYKDDGLDYAEVIWANYIGDKPKIPYREPMPSFRSSETWKAGLDRNQARVNSLQEEYEGLERTQQVIAFRRSILQNVIWLYEIVGFVQKWQELSVQTRDGLLGSGIKDKDHERILKIGVALEEYLEKNPPFDTFGDLEKWAAGEILTGPGTAKNVLLGASLRETGKQGKRGGEDVKKTIDNILRYVDRHKDIEKTKNNPK